MQRTKERIDSRSYRSFTTVQKFEVLFFFHDQRSSGSGNPMEVN